MINLCLALLVFAIALTSEILTRLEWQKKVNRFGGSDREPNHFKRMRLVRPLLAAIMVWVVSFAIEKSTLERNLTASSRSVNQVD